MEPNILIKCYSKDDLRYLFRNPHTDLSTRKCRITGEIVQPVSHKVLQQNLERHFKDLGLANEEEYKSIRLFSPRQVAFIINLLF